MGRQGGASASVAANGCAVMIALLTAAFARQVMAETPTGVLRVKTDIAGAAIKLDGQDAGTTPTTIKDVAAGSHELRISKGGFEDAVETVQVEVGKTAQRFLVMKPVGTPLPDLPATFEVIHQHRNGLGCHGRLTVNADSVEYKAADSDDAFHIRISDVSAVSRSLGTHLVIGAPGGVMGFTDSLVSGAMPCQVQTDHSEDGFWVADASDARKPIPERTKELYDLVYRLWLATRQSGAQ